MLWLISRAPAPDNNGRSADYALPEDVVQSLRATRGAGAYSNFDTRFDKASDHNLGMGVDQQSVMPGTTQIPEVIIPDEYPVNTSRCDHSVQSTQSTGHALMSACLPQDVSQ
jgi:hypothetical protein